MKKRLGKKKPFKKRIFRSEDGSVCMFVYATERKRSLAKKVSGKFKTPGTGPGIKKKIACYDENKRNKR